MRAGDATIEDSSFTGNRAQLDNTPSEATDAAWWDAVGGATVRVDGHLSLTRTSVTDSHGEGWWSDRDYYPRSPSSTAVASTPGRSTPGTSPSPAPRCSARPVRAAAGSTSRASPAVDATVTGNEVTGSLPSTVGTPNPTGGAGIAATDLTLLASTVSADRGAPAMGGESFAARRPRPSRRRRPVSADRAPRRVPARSPTSPRMRPAASRARPSSPRSGWGRSATTVAQCPPWCRRRTARSWMRSPPTRARHRQPTPVASPARRAPAATRAPWNARRPTPTDLSSTRTSHRPPGPSRWTGSDRRATRTRRTRRVDHARHQRRRPGHCGAAHGDPTERRHRQRMDGRRRRLLHLDVPSSPSWRARGRPCPPAPSAP